MCVIDNYSILRTHVLAQSSRLILNLSFPRKLPSRYPSPRVSVVTLLFAHRPVFLLSCTECQTCVSAELSELVYLVFATELTDTKGKNYPFYVHRPVCLISTYTGTVTHTGTNRLEDISKEM